MSLRKNSSFSKRIFPLTIKQLDKLRNEYLNAKTRLDDLNKI